MFNELNHALIEWARKTLCIPTEPFLQADIISYHVS